jgi:hypothetical protein
LVRLAALWRYQLRYGARRLGSALGALLARPSVPVMDHKMGPREKQDRWLLAEGFILGAILLGMLALALTDALSGLYRWVLHLFV